MDIYLKRKIDSFLQDWKANDAKKPLIVKGARQVGKSESITRFGEANYESVVIINFATDPHYKNIVENGYSAEAVVKNMSRFNSAFRFIEGKTLIFFDEVQEFPDIMTSLKFFSQDGRFDVICSGSLLGINYERVTSIAVGFQTEYELRSLDFEEFSWALGYDDALKNEILEHMASFKPFSPGVLKFYSDLFYDYCLLGGMPEVVRDYVKKKTFENTLAIQKDIVKSYERDIRKYASGLDRSRISSVFRSVPSQLGKENKKFQMSKVKKGAKYDDYRGALEWLSDAGIVNLSRALSFPTLPLRGNEVEDSFVVYYADSGLLLSQLDEEAQADFRMNKNIDTYKGGLFESIIAEALVKSGYELHYYKKKDSTLQEEFFVRRKDYVVPIEVKAKNNNSKSLKTLIQSPNYPEISFGIKLIRGNIGYMNNIISFPHFAAFLIKEFLSTFEPR